MRASLSQNKLTQLRLLVLKKHRSSQGLYRIEGFKLLDEAFRSDLLFDFVVCSKECLEDPRYFNLIEKIEDRGILIFESGVSILQGLSELEQSDGLIAVIQSVTPNLNELWNNQSFVVLDGVSDPGNLGTIMRTADWFGISSLVLGSGCADSYSIKTIRASMGAVFRMKIYERVALHGFLQEAREHSYCVTLADVRAKRRLSECEFFISQKYAFVFGGESHGADPSLFTQKDLCFSIHGVGRAESLNVGVAAGVVFHAFFEYQNYEKNQQNI